jgi:hypothetical protein
MFTDVWLLSQLLLQICCFFLLLYAVVYATELVRHWQPALADERQLLLEHKNYLLGAISQFVLLFQVFGLAFFMLSANVHLPSLIKGAMCASGVLAANEYGYPLLAVKTGSIGVYSLFLCLQYLDNQEPTYPLTPKKYIFLFPSFVLLLLDLTLQVLFYEGINPDRIVTCCSLTFLGNPPNETSLLTVSNLVKPVLLLFTASFVLLVAMLLKIGNKKLQNIYFQALVVILYLASAVFSLKHFFVKYIYGLPTHNCLFDLFLPIYYSVGFIIFGAYYCLLISFLFKLLLHFNQKYLQNPQEVLLQTLNRNVLWATLLSFLIPVFYWCLWTGNM